MINQDEKVDVILATYNTDIGFLTKQIDSILNQTYANIKLYISDDNSTESKVLEVLQQYEKNDQRIQLFTQKYNLGYIKNFEFLLQQTTSNYIAFADHDDIWYENKIEESVKALKQNDVDLVYCDAKQIDENDKVIQESYTNYKKMPKLYGKNNILAFSRSVSIGCSQMITKSVKEKMLPFKADVMAHDWLSVFIASINKGAFYIDKPLFGYRLHNSNVFGGRSFRQNIDRAKKENGKSYKEFLNYREKTIDTAYLNGSLMCLKYVNNDKKENYNEVIQYYNNIKKSKILNMRIKQYYKILGYKGIGNRAIKEIQLFHFPILSYIIYLFM